MIENKIDKKILEAAIGLFGGDKPKALNWLNSPARALGGVIPVDASTNDVLLLINRLECGVLQ
ncbi:MbcA/ParS/Xre antitoxin family protein [Pseudomonas nitroreducens]|uniref:antitoxin Xre/MbcA/ParS toxin-binding domain-containing protein n=1 Tax=Pseudomonas nitroreducens TaxID=46680 RepID=UPI001474604E|nr:antitoxin Xre/MbcA/ParS toxin-binding domain-containing protein [Pseudomonas nitroreducens]MDG9856969.1 MbcA/ParS/Xre antitoxin family protein [Pseudomonas nitroreducens]MDH1075773.1 MbcA/ParS/Xre antitoxin family protein [Pseudomonas nitroreducens]NMZ76681.1 DUF2384 domain-containing protein [Pseudomonas nitroreducens]